MQVHSRRLGRLFSTGLMLTLAAFMLAACSGGPPLPKEGGTMPAGSAGMGDNGSGQQRRDIDVRGLAGIPAGDRDQFTDPNNPLSTRIIYFDYDKSAIPSRFTAAIQAHAKYLSQHPDVKLRLEGNTDDRGTREYNVALGERRAESVKQALVLSGAGANQISTLSFGEERPAVLGHDEDAYSKNRRVEFIYTQ